MVTTETKKPTLTASKIDMLFRCGEQYRRRYIEGEIIPPGVALPLGTAVHKAAEMNLNRWLETGEYLPVEEVETIASDTFKHEWIASEVRLTEDEMTIGPSKLKGMMVDESALLARTHWTDVAPILEPVAIERQWRIILDNFPFDLSGRTDVEQSQDVRDLKITGKSPSASEADTSLQLTLYSIAFANQYGSMPEKVVLDHLVRNKKPRYIPTEAPRERRHLDAALRRIEVAADMITKELWVPARCGDWTCTPKWCGYYATCEYAH